jgi:hypothetical protein
MRAALLIIALALPIASYGEEPTTVCEKPAADSSAVSLGTPVASATLAAQRGGDDSEVHNTIHINGEVTDNTATNVVTGANSIQDGSFSNASGIMSVVQNTGANVLIQSATIVNVQFANP